MPSRLLVRLALSGWLILSAASKTAAQLLPPPAPVSPSALLELTLGQARTLALPRIERFLVGDPSLLSVEQVNANTLKLIPQSFGRTFLHIWSAEGRKTVVVRILPVRVPLEARERAIAGALEHAESLKIGYDVEYELVHRGPTFSESDQDTTTAIRHVLTHEMETPYGDTSSLVEFSRVNTFQDLTTWSARLTDGRVGWVQDFDAIAGDATMPFGAGSFAIPSVGYRGATFDYRGLSPWRAAALWGRERFGAFATLTGEPAAERDSFFSGFHLGYGEPGNRWTARATTLFGSGGDRLATQSSHVVDLFNEVRLTDPWSIDSEVAFSQEAVGYTLGSSWKAGRDALRLMFRDVDEEFETIVGASGFQGERGLLLDGQWSPLEALSFRGRADLYRTRLFPNPAEPGTLNLNEQIEGDWRIWAGTSLSGFANRQRNLGLLSPTDDRSAGGSINQSVPLNRLVPFLRDANISGRFAHHEGRNVSAPNLDFDTEVVAAGVSLPLMGGLTANAVQQWHFLEETRRGVRSRPRRFAAGLSHFATLKQGRWQLRSRLAFEEEANTQSIRSFLAGQDRWTSEAGLRYRPVPWMEFFADGRLEKVRFERTQDDRVEFSVFTGARLLFDTRVIRWDPAASISGVVFHDLNGDGIQQAGEEGLEGIKVAAGPARQTLAGPGGRFAFGRVRGKAVPVSVALASLPSGFVMSTPQVQVIRPKGRSAPPVYFGALGRAEVRGRVFDDLDGDGRYSAPDRGLEGVRLRLDSRAAETDRSGWFFFRSLPGGSYTLSLTLESLPLRYVPQAPLQQPIGIKEGDVVTIDIPVVVRRVLKGRVYLDANQNRQFDIGERGLAGIPLCLDGRRVTTTDQAGVYRFPEVGPGRHTVLLNCGMPLRELLPLSRAASTVEIGHEDPETVGLDFRLERMTAVIEEILRERDKTHKTDSLTGP